MQTLSSQNLDWNVYKKMAFRLAFIFFGLSIINMGYFIIPFWDETVGLILQKFLDIIIPWIGKHLFHISYPIVDQEDGAYGYVLFFTIAMATVIGTIIWSLLDNKRESYKTLYYWLTTAVRFFLGLTLFWYGMRKIIPQQFPAPDIYRLTEQVGNMAPYDLAWLFLGFSRGYNIFMGLAELAALLLLFRRTMTLGAIITLMVTANIMAVDYFYDVSIKIIIAVFVVMTLFLLLNDADRLFKIFFTGQPTPLPVIKSPVFKKRWMNISKTVFKFLIIGSSIIYGTNSVLELKNKTDEYNKAISKLIGLYDVDTFVVNRDTLSSSPEYPTRWNQLVIGPSGNGLRGSAARYNGDNAAYVDVDTTHHIIRLINFYDNKFRAAYDSANPIYEAAMAEKVGSAKRAADSARAEAIMAPFVWQPHYELSNPDILKLSGTIKKDSVFIIARKKPVDIKNFRLMKKSFHWITDDPDNPYF